LAQLLQDTNALAQQHAENNTALEHRLGQLQLAFDACSRDREALRASSHQVGAAGINMKIKGVSGSSISIFKEISYL
jgi:hypothetical protein